MSGATWHDYVAAIWLRMRKTHGKWREREREEKSEIKIFAKIS